MTADEHPVSWLRAILPLPPAGSEIPAVEALRRCGARAVERHGRFMHAWFAMDASPPDASSLGAELRAALRTVMHLDESDIRWEVQAHGEWLGDRAAEFSVRRIGERMVVVPTVPGRAGDASYGDDDVVIRLHPGGGFGSAAHPTTRACLRLVEGLCSSGDRVLDIGTGNGVLAIAAAKCGATDVLALDADRIACDEARRNAALNGVDDVVQVRLQRVGAGDLPALAPLDLVLANVEYGLLMDLLPGLSDVLAPRGRLVVAGITGGEWPRFLDAATAVGLALLREVSEDGWVAAALAVAR